MSDPNQPRTTWPRPTGAPRDARLGIGDEGTRVPPSGAEHGPAPRRRWPWVTGAVLVVLALACFVASRIDLNYYVLSPGLAQPVGPLVKVPPSRAHRLVGKVLLTDVYLTRVTALSYLFDKLSPHDQLVPVQTVLGPTTPPSQLLAQGYLEMAQSQAAAKAAALTALGYKIGGAPAGALIFAVVPGSPASRVLSVANVVTAVDGKPTKDACALSQALARQRPGGRVSLTVERSQVTARARMRPGRTVTEPVTLARWPTSVPHPVATPACPGIGRSTQGFLGVEAETRLDFHFPFPITLGTTSIGGPSAGLAMTLGIIDVLSDGHLTGGRTVAATGTIAPTGAVGAVGGVPQKTVAVEAARASVFFVPAAQVRTARSQAGAGLRVIGVRSLAQALADLRQLGGSGSTGSTARAAASRARVLNAHAPAS